jgi:hypothetical protein
MMATAVSVKDEREAINDVMRIITQSLKLF